MKKGISRLISFVALTMICSIVFMGCSTNNQSSTDEKETAAVEETKSDDAAETEDTQTTEETQTTEDTQEAAASSDLPVTGIGVTIDTQVKATGDYKIGYIAKNSTNPYMVAQAAGVTKAGEVMGFKAITQAPATADSVEEQVKIMEDMIQQGVNAIIVHCVDTNGIMPGVRKAEEAGITVVTIGTPAAEETFLRTGVNYRETGEVIATQVAEKLGGKGKVIILEGPPGAANAIERLEGIKSVFAKYSDIEIVASQTANFKRTEGMQVTENLIQKYTDINAIIGMNDESALGAIQALKAAGMTGVLVAGFDGSADATSAVESGDMYVTYNTDPYGSGFTACAYIVQFLNDGTTPSSTFIPFPSAANDPLITADTVADYKENIAWWKAVQQ